MVEPATYLHQQQVLVTHTLLDTGLEGCISVISTTFEETLRNFGDVLDQVREANLTCKPKKCKLFCTKVAFLGDIFSAANVECDQAKSDKVASWPTTTNLKDLQSFLGLASYYRRFVLDNAAISMSLMAMDLTKYGHPLVWTAVQNETFV